MSPWAEPVIPIEVGQSQDQGIYLPDGRVQVAVEFVLRADDIERIRLGYVCAKCLEPHEQAWPERCVACGAPIREEQAEVFAREFGGEVPVGPATSLADELERLPEEVAKEAERSAARP